MRGEPVNHKQHARARMRRIASGTEIVIASHNAGKVAEVRALLQPFGVHVVSAADLGLPEPVETEDSFVGNALLKARAAAQASGRIALSDDSGLEVRALGGAPGVYTADWAGEPRDWMAAMRKVEAALNAAGATDRAARFVCVLALVWPDGAEAAFRGEVTGALVWPPRGDNGFGFDPVFVPHGAHATFAEMLPAQKHRISHRADAFDKLVEACFAV